MSVFDKVSASKGGVVFEPEVFNSVTANTTESTVCSPKGFGPDWQGIAIAMPNKITFDARASSTIIATTTAATRTKNNSVLLCGFYQLALTALASSESPLRFFIRNIITNERYQGDFVDLDESPEAPLPVPSESIDPSRLEGMLAGSYFNPNLRDYVGFPVASASYEIYVEYGGMQSNKVMLEIVVK